MLVLWEGVSIDESYLEKDTCKKDCKKNNQVTPQRFLGASCHTSVQGFE